MSGSKVHWLPCGAATLVGSLPHKDRHKAISLVFQEMQAIPGWPQLSSYPMEQMLVQYNEGLPGLIEKDRLIVFNTEDSGFEEELLHFYEEYLAVTGAELALDRSRFRFGDEAGKSFFAFLERFASADPVATAVKGQTVGPFTLVTSVKNERGKLALYDSRLRDVVIKNLALKAQWQTEQLGRFSLPVIVCIDEPALAGFGSSAFISVSSDDVIAMFEEVVSHIHQAGGLAGMHVCANTDWSLFFASSLDLINFDAYTYFDRFSLYREDLVAFINRGGLVAWGIVPTMDEQNIMQENVDSLAGRWRQQVELLTGPDLALETIFRQSLITPSCGCGTLSEPISERVIQLTRHVSERLRQQFED